MCGSKTSPWQGVMWCGEAVQSHVTGALVCQCTWCWIAVHHHTCMKCHPRLSDNDTAALSAALPPASKGCTMPCHSLVSIACCSGNLPGISLSSPCLCRGIDIDCRNTARMELPSIWYIANSIRKRGYRDTTVQTPRRDKTVCTRNSGSLQLHCTLRSTQKSLARFGRACDLYLVCHTLPRHIYTLNTSHRTHTVCGHGHRSTKHCCIRWYTGAAHRTATQRRVFWCRSRRLMQARQHIRTGV